MSKFSFRRKSDKEFKHIAHGLIPAASIAPKPAVPRTPPPRSPDPSPERPRSALAAAILSSSLTGRTFAIPPARPRSLSESDRSHSLTLEPNASTALYTRDRWPEYRLPSPDHSEEEMDDEEELDEEEHQEEEEEREVLSEEEQHVYQTLDRHANSPITEPIYARPIKHTATPPQPEQRTMPSPELTEDPEAICHSAEKKSSGRRSGRVSEASQAYREVLEVQKDMVRTLTEQNVGLAEERRVLEERCSQQYLQLQRLEQEIRETRRRPSTGIHAELQTLRHQAQELVDENDSLKQMVHRLTVELSHYQATFRPLSKHQNSRSNSLPVKGSPPPWLLDMKYLSPLLLAYEDRMSEKDSLLKAAEEELERLGHHVEEVVRENERLHKETIKTGGISHKEWRELQQQAGLVLKENQVLLEQLEAQQTRTRTSHRQHHHHVSRVSKQLMLLEEEKQHLQEELEGSVKEVQALRSRLEDAVTWEEHCSITSKLKRQLEEEENRKQREEEALLQRVSLLQEKKRSLEQENTSLTADIRSMEDQLERSQQANRKAQTRMSVMKLQVEECVKKEMKARHFLSSMVSLAEKTSQEREQLIHMASAFKQDKQGSLGRILEGTVRLGKLQEKIKVYRQRASAGLEALEERLQEQEQEFAGRTASYHREILHLHRLLADRQTELDRLLQHRQEIEEELELVWQAATRENQSMRESLLNSSPSGGLQGLAVHHGASPSWLSQAPEEDFTASLQPQPPFTVHHSLPSRPHDLQRSPMFESDSDQHQNNSSDESEKHRLDFYS